MMQSDKSNELDKIYQLPGNWEDKFALDDTGWQDVWNLNHNSMDSVTVSFPVQPSISDSVYHLDATDLQDVWNLNISADLGTDTESEKESDLLHSGSSGSSGSSCSREKPFVELINQVRFSEVVEIYEYIVQLSDIHKYNNIIL